MIRIPAVLRTVPRLDRTQWEALGLINRWAVATRLSVLVMTAASAGIGALLAVANRHFDPLPWVLCLLGLLFAHATSNLVNDYVDFRRSVDDGDYPRARYGTHVLLAGLMQERDLARYIAVTGAIALTLGLSIAALRGPLVLLLMSAGALLLLFYTWPLKYLGLGEPAVLLTWGPLMVGGSYFVASGHWSWAATLIGLIYGLGPTAVLLGKHVDKLELDAAKGIRTVPVLIGSSRALRLLQSLLCLQLLIIPFLVVLELATPWLLLLLLTLPDLRAALTVFSAPSPDARPENHPRHLWPLWYTHQAFLLNRRIGGYFLLGLLMAALTSQMSPL